MMMSRRRFLTGRRGWRAIALGRPKVGIENRVVGGKMLRGGPDESRPVVDVATVRSAGSGLVDDQVSRPTSSRALRKAPCPISSSIEKTGRRFGRFAGVVLELSDRGPGGGRVYSRGRLRQLSNCIRDRSGRLRGGSRPRSRSPRARTGQVWCSSVPAATWKARSLTPRPGRSQNRRCRRALGVAPSAGWCAGDEPPAGRL